MGKTSTFEKEIKMLEYLILQIDGFFEGKRMLMVRNQDGRLTWDYYLLLRKYSGETLPHFHAVWTKERSKRWVKQLDALSFEAWQDHYNSDILDGTQWELRYKYPGMPERCITGSNAYPDDWELFRKWVDAAVRKLPRVEDATIDELLYTIYISAAYVKNQKKSAKGDAYE